MIVFDAGTNDNPSYPQILAGNLAKVAAMVGDRCMVVPTIHGLHPGGVDDSGKNQVVGEFAASRPGTQTPDWQGAVFRHPELMQADNLHPIEAGAELRARLIAQGVMACLAGSTGASASSAPARPALEQAPKHLPPVDAMEDRRDEILASVANALIFETIRRMSRRAPLLAPATLAWMEAASIRHSGLGREGGASLHSASRPGRSGGASTPQLKSSPRRSGVSPPGSASAWRTSALIVNQARMPPRAARAAQTTIPMWKPSVIFAGS